MQHVYLVIIIIAINVVRIETNFSYYLLCLTTQRQWQRLRGKDRHRRTNSHTARSMEVNTWIEPQVEPHNLTSSHFLVMSHSWGVESSNNDHSSHLQLGEHEKNQSAPYDGWRLIPISQLCILFCNLMGGVGLIFFSAINWQQTWVLRIRDFFKNQNNIIYDGLGYICTLRVCSFAWCKYSKVIQSRKFIYIFSFGVSFIIYFYNYIILTSKTYTLGCINKLSV